VQIHFLLEDLKVRKKPHVKAECRRHNNLKWILGVWMWKCGLDHVAEDIYKLWGLCENDDAHIVP
jgi:hypothetical protein